MLAWECEPLATPAEAGCKEEPAEDRLSSDVALECGDCYQAVRYSPKDFRLNSDVASECGDWFMVCEPAPLGG